MAKLLMVAKDVSTDHFGELGIACAVIVSTLCILDHIIPTFNVIYPL